MIAFWLRFFLSTVKAWISLVILASLSISLYALFYQWHIPHFVLTYPIFFQFDVACHHLATMRGDEAGPGKGLEACQFVHYDLHCSQHYFKRGQLYDMDLRLEMPDSQANRALGMFMVRLRLYDSQDQLLLQTARPGLYPYQSLYVRLLKLVFGTAFHLLGYFSESSHLKVDLIDQHVHQLDSIPFTDVARIYIEIETYRTIEIVPPSHLRITARLSGIQYWMYFWPVTSCILITSLIFALLLFVSLVILICNWFSKKSTQYLDTSGQSPSPGGPTDEFQESLSAQLPRHQEAFCELTD